jgi:hypothetical protein
MEAGISIKIKIVNCTPAQFGILTKHWKITANVTLHQTRQGGSTKGIIVLPTIPFFGGKSWANIVRILTY